MKKKLPELKRQPGRDILVGSRSLIAITMNLNLVDEFQLCVHPAIAGTGLPLFDDMNDRLELGLLKTKVFRCGGVIFYYKSSKKQ